ncbi:MAG TPA: class A beta-lactamase [Gammaproteobacteria bacterium]|nr:class A beta-lactamase [Gammaproteobacteria bacterium]
MKYLLLSIMTITFAGMTLPALASTPQEQFAALEKSANGQLGVAAINTANNQAINYRANQRFPMECTAKLIGVAAVLKKSMTNPQLLQQKVTYKKSDLVSWSPITEKHVNTGMTVKQLCKAAIIISDNTAINLLIKNALNGSPDNLNNFARSIGDTTFNQVDWWPQEAETIPGEKRNTTTPLAMEKSVEKITLGNVLAPSQHDDLLTWMKEDKTGNKRIRAGVPKGWMVADKTGTGDYYGIVDDIAVIWPPHAKPIILVTYFAGDQKNAPKQENILAKATRIIIKTYFSTPASA